MLSTTYYFSHFTQSNHSISTSCYMVSILRASAIGNNLSMDPLIYTYADIDRLLNWIDTSEQRAASKFYAEVLKGYHVGICVREFDFRGLNSWSKEAKGVKAWRQ